MKIHPTLSGLNASQCARVAQPKKNNLPGFEKFSIAQNLCGRLLGAALVTALGTMISVDLATAAPISAVKSSGYTRLTLTAQEGQNIIYREPTFQSVPAYYGHFTEQVDVLGERQVRGGQRWYRVKPSSSPDLRYQGWVASHAVTPLTPLQFEPPATPIEAPTPHSASVQFPTSSPKPVQETVPKPVHIEVPAPASPAPGSLPPKLSNPSLESFTPEQIKYFLEIAMGSEFGGSTATIKKWQGNVRIKVIGSPTTEDLNTLRSVISEINSLTNGQANLSLDDKNPNLKLYFVPESSFKRYEPNYQPINFGYFWARLNGDTIYSANVLITTVNVTQKERSHLIREELTQVLGLMKDSWRYKDSIFYQGWTETTEFTASDRALIKMLYQPDIRPGMRRNQVASVLNRLQARK